MHEATTIPKAIIREFRRELRCDPPNFMDFHYNEFLLDLFDGQDIIDLRTLLLLDFDEDPQQWVACVEGTATLIGWGLANGLLEHINKRGPSEAFRLLERRQQFVLIGKPPRETSLRILAPTLPLDQIDRLMAKERRRIQRDGPLVAAETRAFLDEGMEQFPTLPLPHSLREFRREGFDLLRNYRDLLIDAAGGINGEWVKSRVREAVRAASHGMSSGTAETTWMDVVEDDAEAICQVDFDLAQAQLG